ncbi:MAG: hypothetical protein AAFV88_22770, partial [Planctomycetota bacterium]
RTIAEVTLLFLIQMIPRSLSTTKLGMRLILRTGFLLGSQAITGGQMRLSIRQRRSTPQS